MARMESYATLRDSGWSLTVTREVEDLSAFTEGLMEEAREGLEGNMDRALDYVIRAIQVTLSRVFGGIPSPPGTPPGYISGELSRGWQKGRISWREAKTVLRGIYFNKHPAAGRHEFGDPGTRTGIAMPSRPSVRPTLVREADAITAILDGQ